MRKSDAAKLTLKLLNFKGVINIGGKTQSVYDFAKTIKKDIKKIKLNKVNKLLLGKNTSMKTYKLKSLLK